MPSKKGRNQVRLATPARYPSKDEILERAKNIVPPWQGASWDRIVELEKSIDGRGMLCSSEPLDHADQANSPHQIPAGIQSERNKE
jgi:hypothetical protein